MIELKNICKKFENATAVNDISFTVEEGETLVLLGTSGCGKTTTLRMINRLLEPSSGTIYFNGRDIIEESAEDLRRSMGYVLQHTGLFPHYTIAENIATVPKLLKWNKKKIADRTEELLEKVKLNPATFLHLYPHQLSGGQQQRVGLARALAANPPILLMDEPFGALDPVTRVAIRKDFNQLDELNAKTIILVTHDVQEAFELGDKICLMHKGQIIQIGTPAQLLFNPANSFVTEFLKDQQFLLELQAITLNDVWNELHEEQKTFTTHQLMAEESLWSALQKLSQSSSSADNFFVQKNEVVKTIYTSTIMQAYQQYKFAKTHG